MYKFILLAMMIVSSLAYAQESQPAGELPGVEVTVGEYASLGELDVKVLNWGFFADLPPKPILGILGISERTLKNKDQNVIQVDLLFKNAGEKPVYFASSFLDGTLVGKDESSFNLSNSALRERRRPATRLHKTILPGQPIYTSLYVLVDASITPAKLVLMRRGAEEVIRVFLQQNLPQEEIPGTTHTPGAVSQPESGSQPSAAEKKADEGFGGELKGAAEEAAKSEVKSEVRRQTRKTVRKLLKF